MRAIGNGSNKAKHTHTKSRAVGRRGGEALWARFDGKGNSGGGSFIVIVDGVANIWSDLTWIRDASVFHGVTAGE